MIYRFKHFGKGERVNTELVFNKAILFPNAYFVMDDITAITSVYYSVRT